MPTRIVMGLWRFQKGPSFDFLDRQQDQRRPLVGPQDAAAVEPQSLAANAGKLVLHFKILELTIARNNLFQQLAQLGNIPAAAADVIEQASRHVALAQLKHREE